MVSSAMRLRGDPPLTRPVQNVDRAAAIEATDAAGAPDVARPTDEVIIVEHPHKTTSLPSYALDRVAAQAYYLGVRTTQAEVYRGVRLSSLDTREGELKAAAARYTQQLRHNHSEQSTLRAERATLIEMGRTAADPAHAAREFEALMQMAGVVGVRTGPENTIVFTVRAQHKRGRAVYDIGDYDIELGPSQSYLAAQCVRSGVRPGYRGGPVYGPLGGYFCFGSQQGIINEHVARGQFVEAMNLAIRCLSSFNRGDASKVPSAFKRLALEERPAQP